MYLLSGAVFLVAARYMPALDSASLKGSEVRMRDFTFKLIILTLGQQVKGVATDQPRWAGVIFRHWITSVVLTPSFHVLFRSSVAFMLPVSRNSRSRLQSWRWIRYACLARLSTLSDCSLYRVTASPSCFLGRRVVPPALQSWTWTRSSYPTPHPLSE